MLKTKNIYYAAFLFTESRITYAGCEVINDIGNKTGVIFSFKGHCLEDEELTHANYEDAMANVNIREYLDELMYVRDIMYRELNKRKPKDKKTGIHNEYKKARRINAQY
jgi:hypothetical protein